MSVKMWSLGDIRSLARQTVDGRSAIVTARGAYFRALVESAQAKLDGNADSAAQMAALKAVHRAFYPIVQEATTTPEIRLDKKVPPAERKRRALERNRRTNFARHAYSTIRRWLKASGHDLLKLDAKTVTKPQLLADAAPIKPHALTPQRIQARADRLIDQLVGFTKQIAKADQAQAARVVEAAMQQLLKFTTANVQATTDASVAAREGRPLRVGKNVFMPTTEAMRKTA